AVGTDQQNARVLAVAGDELQQQKRWMVGIVEIVDYDHQRSDARHVLEKRCHRLEQLEARLLRISRLRSGMSRSRSVCGTQLGKQLRDIRNDLGRRLRAENRCTLFGVGVAKARAKDLDPRPIGGCAATLPAPTPSHAYALRDSRTSELIREPGLADSRLAA